MPRRILVALAVCAAAACGGSRSPSGPSSPAAAPVIEGQTLNVLDGAAASGVSVQVSTEPPVVTDSNGMFRVDLETAGAHPTVVRGKAFVERRTNVNGGTGQRARVTLIPSSFPTSAFDEMFRGEGGQLQRWTSAPALVVLASEMKFTGNGTADTFTAAGEQLSDDEVSQLLDHLREGLALLTGNSFREFASVHVERPEQGKSVLVARQNTIVVGRYQNLRRFTNTIGYGRWAALDNGTIVGGAMFLDRNFDRDDARRRLLRIHELGHALGYSHVESHQSIMNPAVGPEPSDFDRQGAVIAFQRPPGNRAPDTDPSSYTLSAVTGATRWSKPIFCR